MWYVIFPLARGTASSEVSGYPARGSGHPLRWRPPRSLRPQRPVFIGCTILLHEMVLSEACLRNRPTRGWEWRPSLLAHLSHFCIVQCVDVLGRVHGSLRLVSLHLILSVLVTQRSSPARGWGCIGKACEVMHLSGVHRSQHRPWLARG